MLASSTCFFHGSVLKLLLFMSPTGFITVSLEILLSDIRLAALPGGRLETPPIFRRKDPILLCLCPEEEDAGGSCRNVALFSSSLPREKRRSSYWKGWVSLRKTRHDSRFRYCRRIHHRRHFQQKASVKRSTADRLSNCDVDSEEEQ